MCIYIHTHFLMCPYYIHTYLYTRWILIWPHGRNLRLFRGCGKSRRLWFIFAALASRAAVRVCVCRTRGPKLWVSERRAVRIVVGVRSRERETYTETPLVLCPDYGKLFGTAHTHPPTNTCANLTWCTCNTHTHTNLPIIYTFGDRVTSNNGAQFADRRPGILSMYTFSTNFRILVRTYYTHEFAHLGFSHTLYICA